MRTVNLIQFLAPEENEIGYEPNLLEYYKVYDMDDSIFGYDQDDDYQEIEVEYAAIAIKSKNTRHGLKKVLKNKNTVYNLLTFELDDSSDLFK